MPDYQELEQRTRAAMAGQALGATRILRINPLAAAVANNTSVQAQTMRIRNPCILFAMYGQVASALAADQATTEVRVQFNGSRDLITDGDNGTYAPFFALFGQAQNWFPLEIDASKPMDIATYYRVVNGNSATPSLLFAAIELV